MHHPRCLDPQSQSGEHPYKLEGGGCYLGKPGHCRRCPHRGKGDPRVLWLNRAEGYAPGAPSASYPEGLPRTPDTMFSNGKMPKEVAEFLWPQGERDWIARENKWAERADYHLYVARSELIRELLREIHDLRAALGWEGDE